MDSPSKLRMISRVAGTLALAVSLGRVWFAVVKHTPVPWLSVIASVLICAAVWWLPESAQQRAQAAQP